MATTQTIPTRLSNLQIELLKLYPYSVSEKELGDIRKILSDYFAKKIDSEMDELWEKNDWGDQTIESWKSEHIRSKSSK
ncbi:hypothetical protein [Dyadobacter fanqingshengii]|uniref:Uncharacterized protein n=1 Tax=Dyadobacter fanqingshengii TaxID=2906443 RepID=A0A9X1PF69_9BACT|nr:hypothetical protein [Dyadobacter fanqingshengii]MCF0042763.1 hypothetical protein [Dyadobacter fanqingshengii]MCF2504466.1 hypothetical protein [Dyadobacter fanqingshengii]USJ36015.1 hypothetical protein NFI81_25455 [Dyadobacter fanqingshengii]